MQKMGTKISRKHYVNGLFMFYNFHPFPLKSDLLTITTAQDLQVNVQPIILFIHNVYMQGNTFNQTDKLLPQKEEKKHVKVIHYNL